MAQSWTSALYKIRTIPANARKQVMAGFCWFSPHVLPRSCTWCGRPMRLVDTGPETQPMVACDMCDHWGAWP